MGKLSRLCVCLRKADLGRPLPLGHSPSLSPHAILRLAPHSLLQQNEIQLIQLKQFWKQLLKAFDVR